MLDQTQRQRLLEHAVGEFAPEWELVGECVPLSVREPNDWLSGAGTYGATLRHRVSGALKVVGKRQGDEPNASYHRGISFRVIEAYGERNTDPMRRFLQEIGAAGLEAPVARPAARRAPVSSPEPTPAPRPSRPLARAAAPSTRVTPAPAITPVRSAPSGPFAVSAPRVATSSAEPSAPPPPPRVEVPRAPAPPLPPAAPPPAPPRIVPPMAASTAAHPSAPPKVKATARSRFTKFFTLRPALVKRILGAESASAGPEVSGRVFTGSSPVLDLTRVTPTLSVSGKTVRLELSFAQGEALIVFECSRVVHAQFAGQTGEKALASILAAYGVRQLA
jgi:hypothetical protein